MPLETVKDFDFGVGGNIKVTQRVSASPSDVSNVEVDFIVWLMLEQEFRKTKRRREIAIQQQRISRRTQYDGLSKEDDGDEIDRPMISNDPENEKLRIAREYAEEILRSEGQNVLWQDLSETYREQMLLQLCKNCAFMQEASAIQSVPGIFERLRSSQFRSNFSVKKHLAKGGFGEVYLVTKDDDPSCKHYAVKKITPYESHLEDIKAAINESKILTKLKGHKNIVEIYESWLEIEPTTETSYMSSMSNIDDEYEEGPLKFYIQLEFCSPSLEAWKESNHQSGIVLEKSQILDMALQIFDGLAYMHAKIILHLDINPKNILWKDPSCTQLKIVDFGLAREAESHNTKDGTAGYIAPETPLTHKSDVYSASVTIIEVGKTIYTKIELDQTIRLRVINTGIPCLDAYLCRSLDDDPTKRLSAAEMVQELNSLKLQ